MSEIEDLIAQFRASNKPVQTSDGALRLACSVDAGADDSEITLAWTGTALSEDLRELWRCTRSAKLFEDVDYGQWGLKVLSPRESADRTAIECAARPADVRIGDVVIGEFLGDQELLIITADEGKAVVALPLDPRDDWYRAAPSLSEFLASFLRTRGAKFWEQSSAG